MSDSNHTKEMLQKIESKIDKIADDQTQMKITLTEQKGVLDGQAVQLETHIRRTELAEESISLLRKDLRPVERHVEIVNAFLKALGLLAALTGAVVGVIKLFL